MSIQYLYNMPDIENAQRIFDLLDQFKTCSGLQVNYKKPKLRGSVLVEMIQRHP